MNEKDIKAAAVELAQAARAKGLVNVGVEIGIRDNDDVRAILTHGERLEMIFGHGANVQLSIADMRAKIAAIPSEKERNTRAAVEALEAAWLACSKIDADDVAASLASRMSRLSEDLLEHKEGAA